jgi:hypothetical protein
MARHALTRTGHRVHERHGGDPRKGHAHRRVRSGPGQPLSQAHSLGPALASGRSQSLGMPLNPQQALFAAALSLVPSALREQLSAFLGQAGPLYPLPSSSPTSGGSGPEISLPGSSVVLSGIPRSPARESSPL